MPTCTEALPAEVKAYEALLKHQRTCRLCRANGRDLCRKYLALFRKWDALNRTPV